MVFRPFLTLACAAALATAQEAGVMSEQPTSFSVWLDLNVLSRPGAAKPAMPIWFESFQNEPVAAKDGEPPRTVYRLRLRRMPSLHRELLLRVFFNDLPGLQPAVSAWTESGRELFHGATMGVGAGLPTNESLIIPLDGTDYIDITVPGDGSSVRGVFASSLKDAATRQTLDFQAVTETQDPFGNLAAAQPNEEDSKVFGRVKATVDTGIVSLSRKGETAGQWQFDLAGQPLTAVVTFEVLNADLAAPPVVTANSGEPGYASVHWPDLSDPGFRGESRPLEPAMRFQYTGWLRAQFVIPGNLLHSGQNAVNIGLAGDSGSIAIRNVELQLKYNWKHFDYILTPASK
ncbi:MAG: hypothetical protein ABI318_10165 [Chthoniobacteraceae bacterium]